MKNNPIIQSLFSVLCVGGLIFALNGCYPSESLTTSEVDIVVTNYNDNYFNNNSPKSYHLPDTVGVIGDGDPQLEGDEQQFIIDQIARNLDALGWERKAEIDENDLPDVVVVANALVVTTAVSGCIPWYPWWGWYPWYPGWGWGGGWCYPTYLGSYKTGTLTVDMIVPAESGDDVFFRAWDAGVNGLLRSSQEGNQNFVRSTIDQAFEQSPYLKR